MARSSASRLVDASSGDLMKTVAALACSVCLVSCQTVEPPSAAPHPFVGCWDSADGLAREGWTIDPSGWLIGYAINRGEDGSVQFYESMRVERGDGPDVFVATGADGSTTRFPREQTSDADEYRFVNVDHDFPQVITYRTSAGRLDAEISLLDGSNRVEFLKSTCKAK